MAEEKEKHKQSIRFFNDREVRAVWDDEQNCWWFSATDIVRDINNEPDYTKAGNYCRWLKKKLKQEDIELVSDTSGFKKTWIGVKLISTNICLQYMCVL